MNYWKTAGCETPEDAVASPISIPGAVNGVGAETPIRESPPVADGGSACVTVGGTVKVPAEAAAVHVNIAPALVCDASAYPEMFTKPFGSPPVHVTVTP